MSLRNVTVDCVIRFYFSYLFNNNFFVLKSLDFIDFIVVTVSEEFEQHVKHILCTLDFSQRNKVDIALGGESRHKSIFAGLSYFDNRERPDLIVVHDIVRPFVPRNLLLELIEAASSFGASGPVCSLTSTVLQASNGFLDCALQRSKLRNSETPQVFKYSVIKAAYDKCTESDLMFGTECLDLVKKYTNNSVKMIEAEASLLFKVTHKRDLYAVEGLLKESESLHLLNIHCKVNVSQNFKRDLYSSLQSTFARVSSEDFVDFSFRFDEKLKIVVILLFCNSLPEICETLNNLKQYENTKIICVLIVNHSLSMEEIRIKSKEYSINIRRIAYIYYPSNDFEKKQQKAIELIKFVCWNYSEAINKQWFFV